MTKILNKGMEVMLPQALQNAITALGNLPGVGARTAERYAYYLFKNNAKLSTEIADALNNLHLGVKSCPITFALIDYDEEVSPFYEDPTRDKSTILVVEEPLDIYAIEQTKQFRGTYHVLGGAISPIDGITPDQLHIKELLDRIEPDNVKEIIIATKGNRPLSCSKKCFTKNLPKRKLPASLAVYHSASISPMPTKSPYLLRLKIAPVFNYKGELLMSNSVFKKLLIIILGLALIGSWCFAIFKLSDMDSADSNSKSTSLVEQGIRKVIDFTNEYDISQTYPSDETIQAATKFINAPLRKVAHASVYCVMATLIIFIGVILFNHRHYFMLALATILLCFIFALTDEYHQTFIDGRTGQMLDVVIDTIGACIGVIIASTYQLAWWLGRRSN